MHTDYSTHTWTHMNDHKTERNAAYSNGFGLHLEDVEDNCIVGLGIVAVWQKALWRRVRPARATSRRWRTVAAEGTLRRAAQKVGITQRASTRSNWSRKAVSGCKVEQADLLLLPRCIDAAASKCPQMTRPLMALWSRSAPLKLDARAAPFITQRRPMSALLMSDFRRPAVSRWWEVRTRTQEQETISS